MEYVDDGVNKHDVWVRAWVDRVLVAPHIVCCVVDAEDAVPEQAIPVNLYAFVLFTCRVLWSEGNASGGVRAGVG